jgi:hypothetical protein
MRYPAIPIIFLKVVNALSPLSSFIAVVLILVMEIGLSLPALAAIFRFSAAE